MGKTERYRHGKGGDDVFVIMSATTTKRRRSTVATLALLAAASALYLLALGDYDYDGGDVDYHGRQLLQPNWMLRPPKNVLHPLSCAARPRDSCDGVLITSQGGVGTSDFIEALEHVVGLEGGGAAFCVNDAHDVDGFKHLPAWAYRHNSTSLIHSRGPVQEWGRGTCFSKVMVIIGDPVHTIESTYRRFRMTHINKVRRAVGLTDYPRDLALPTLYRFIASSGEDRTGIASYVSSWYEASRDRAGWPEVRIVTARTLLDNAEEQARWIGVGEGRMRRFSRMRYDAGRQRRTGVSVADENIRGKVLTAFRNVTEVVRLVENPSPLVTVGQRRRRRRRRAAQKL